MMNEMFRKVMEQTIKENIKGDALVRIYRDLVVVDIQPTYGHLYKYTFETFETEYESITLAKMVAKEVLKGYKEDILSEYFNYKRLR